MAERGMCEDCMHGMMSSEAKSTRCITYMLIRSCRYTTHNNNNKSGGDACMRPPESPVHQFPSWTTSFALLSIAHITDCSTIHQALLSSPLYSTLHTLLCMCLYIQSLHKAGQGFGWMEREREIAYERTLFLSNLVWATPIFQLPTL